MAGGNDSLLAYYCAIWFFAMTISPLVVRYFGVKWQFDFSYASGCMGYFVLGYLLGKREYSASRATVALLSIFVCVSVIAYMTGVLTVANNNIFVDDFYSYLSPMVVIASASWFVLIKFASGLSIFDTAKQRNRLVVSISACSFGVYLIHVIFIDLCGDALKTWLPTIANEPVASIPLLSVMAFIASYLVILLAGRVKVLRRAIGV